MTIKKSSLISICIFSVFMLSLYILVGVMFTKAPVDAGDNPNNPPDIEIPVEPDEPDDGNPEEKPKPPVFRDGYACLSFALDELFNANSYEMEYKPVMKAAGYEVRAYQNLKKNGTTMYGEVTTYTDNPFKSINYHEDYYTADMKSVAYRRTENSTSDLSYTWKNVTEKEYTFEQVINDVKKDIFVPMIIYPTRQNATLTKFDKTTNSSYYIVTFTIPVSNIPEDYVKEMVKAGGISGISHKSFSMTFYISKSTGTLLNFIKNENYEASLGALKFDTNASTNVKVKNINKDVIIKRTEIN